MTEPQKPLSKAIVEAVLVLADLTGKTFASKTTVEVMARDLAEYPEAAVLEALRRCRREMRAFPTVADVILRIDDGRPGPDAAWAMVPLDEETSCVWTQEMQEAFGLIRHLLGEDNFSARRAFTEHYAKLLANARAKQIPPRWQASLGTDPQKRIRCLKEAVELGRLPAAEARALIPSDADRIAPAPKEPLTLLEAPAAQEPGWEEPPAEECTQDLARVREIMAGVAKDLPTAEKRIHALRTAGEPRELTEDEIARRKELLKQQAERIRELNQEGEPMEPSTGGGNEG